MGPNMVESIATALRQAALYQTVMSYPRLHRMLPANMPVAARLGLLEAAARSLEAFDVCDYGVLLALDCGLPGQEFFLRFRKYRPADYVSALGDPRYTRPKIRSKRVLVEAERQRVYRHAEASKVGARESESV